MIDKPLEDIAYADIETFVQDQWPEGKTVDYKREMYGARDEDKRELLKDVSSFANTQGGDILIGVDENKGIPTGIPGVSLSDPDAEVLRLDEIIRRGLEPRIEFGIHHVLTPAGTSVLILRIKESFLFPHRVVFHGKFGEFWGRSSAGNFSMDTDELRRAFTLSDSIYEQIRLFRQNRVAQVMKDETPLPLMPGGKLLLHLIPVSSFRSRQQFDVASMHELATQFPPLNSGGWNHRLNLDGHVAFGGGNAEMGCRSYTLFFRNGVVESVLSDIVATDKNGHKLLRTQSYESTLTQDHGPCQRILAGLGEVGITPPLWCFMTLTGVKHARIPTNDYFPDESRDIDRDVLMLPEFAIDDLKAKPVTIFRPMFDLVWNASGFARSCNFDIDGNWVG